MSIETMVPVINRPAIEQLITHFIDRPESHNQDAWAVKTASCGTVCCVAGWTVHFAGYEFEWNPVGDNELDEWERELGVTANAGYASTPNGGGQIAELAARILGLTDLQADDIFGDPGDTEHMIGRLKDLLNEAA